MAKAWEGNKGLLRTQARGKQEDATHLRDDASVPWRETGHGSQAQLQADHCQVLATAANVTGLPNSSAEQRPSNQVSDLGGTASTQSGHFGSLGMEVSGHQEPPTWGEEATPAC